MAPEQHKRMRVRVLALIAVMTAAAALTACGDADTPAAPGSPENPLVATPTEDTEQGRSNEAAGRAAAAPGYADLLEQQTSQPRSRFTPCNLVVRAQAQAILGGPVKAPVEAPQGPTCVYRTQSGDDFVTLAVQSADFRRLKKQMKRPQAVEVSDRPAYCGTHGQPMLYVSLADRRVLSIAAPCGVAREFARTAVAQLGR